MSTRSKFLAALIAAAVTLTGVGQASAQSYQRSVVIRNVYSLKVLDVPLDGTEYTTGRPIQQYTANGGRNQVWDLYHNGRSGAPSFRRHWNIRNNLTQRNLGFENNRNGTPLTQHNPDNGEKQKWELIQVGTTSLPGSRTQVPTYIIKNAQTNRVIDVPGWSTDNIFLQSFSENRGTNQLWVLETVPRP
ncbi:MAG: RICIN domain-containing protein [Gemmataceae bacterium]